MCLQRSKVQTQNKMEDLKKRLTRSLSVPRRCFICRKTLYFSVAKCRECGGIVHKHCSHHKHIHQTNVSDNVTTNSIKLDSEVPSVMNQDGQYHGVSDSLHDSDSRFRHMTHSSVSADTPGIAMSGLLKIVRWLSHRRKAKELSCKANAMAVEKHVRGRFGLNPKLDDKEARKKLKALLKSTQNYQKQMYSQQQSQTKQKCSSVRSASSSSSRSSKRFCRSIAIRSDSTVPSSPLSSSVSSYTEYASPFDTPKSKHEEFYNRYYQAKEQTSTKTPFLNFVNYQKNVRYKNGAIVVPNNEGQNNEKSEGLSLPEIVGWTFTDETNITEMKPESSPDVTLGLKCARPPSIMKAKTLSIEKQNFSNESLCATWPPTGKGRDTIDEASEDDGYTEDEIDERSDLKDDGPRTEEALKEWCIPFGDIEFKKIIRHGRNGDIYRGRWYGEVLIYTIHNNCESELRQFLKDVSQMGMIRHENIVLFMGACIEPPKLAVITSMRKGPTLYEYLHLKRHRLPLHSKLNIARQIAQGIGYLHAKEITHGKLNSKNIILESRVKLCMMDHGMADKKYDRKDYGCVPRGQLSYLSPELIRSLQIQPPGIYPSTTYTQKSDIFAFGSLLYELLAERFAFHDQPPQAIIYQIAQGKRCSLENFQFINGLKLLIKKCWSQNPLDRPPFSEIVTTLQENVEHVTHHKRHSSSVPDKLHHVGQSLRRSICT